jgi:three-Cys-motif partner protein
LDTNEQLGLDLEGLPPPGRKASSSEKAAHEERNLENHPQTRAKLDGWRCYLPHFLGKLGYSDRDVFVLDLFAGSGRVSDGLSWSDGSPIIACRLAQAARADFAGRGRDVRFHVRFVELNDDARATLGQLVEPFRADLDIEVLAGKASDNLPALMAESNGHPTIAFIDPDGFKGITFDQVAGFGARKQNEILLNFDVQGLLRTAGIVQTHSVSAFCGGDWWKAYSQNATFDEDGYLSEYGRRLAESFNYVSAQRLDFPAVHANRAIVQGCYSVKGVELWKTAIKAAMPRHATIAFDFLSEMDRRDKVNGVIVRLGRLAGRPSYYGEIRRALGLFDASEDDIHQALLFLRADGLASWSSTLHAMSSPKPRITIEALPEGVAWEGVAWDEIEREREKPYVVSARIGVTR